MIRMPGRPWRKLVLSGLGIANILKALDPEAVVIGGHIVKSLGYHIPGDTESRQRTPVF